MPFRVVVPELWTKEPLFIRAPAIFISPAKAYSPEALVKLRLP